MYFILYKEYGKNTWSTVGIIEAKNIIEAAKTVNMEITEKGDNNEWADLKNEKGVIFNIEKTKKITTPLK